MNRLARAMLAILLAAGGTAAHAQDASVRQRLESRGMKYEIDKDGDFRVVLSIRGTKRTQQVFVSGGVQTIGSVAIRKVFSPAAVLSRNPVDGARALELLRDAATDKIGSWEIQGGVLYLVAKLPDSASAAELATVMDMLTALADDMEQKTSGTADAL